MCGRWEGMVHPRYGRLAEDGIVGEILFYFQDELRALGCPLSVADPLDMSVPRQCQELSPVRLLRAAVHSALGPEGRVGGVR